jgi:glyoxylase I family protein
MSPSRPALSHIALTVTDLDTSLPWYESVFDIKHLMEEAHEGGIGKVLVAPAGT